MTLEQRIRNDIEARIRSGEWRPGRRIPFEHELVAQYGCARATVSKALADLARAGMIERRRKAGSFVALQRVQSAALDIPDIGAIISARGERYSFRLIERIIRPASTANADEARLGAAGNVLCMRGVHLADATAFAAEERIISLQSVPDAADIVFDTAAPGAWLLEHVPWTEARHRISAVSAGRGWSRLLDVPAKEACLNLERWTWRQADPITFVRQIFPGKLHDLVAAFQPTPPTFGADRIQAP